MAIKLTITGRKFVPDFSFSTEDGETVQNRELPAEDQIYCELTIASVGQKSSYVGTYSVASRRGQTRGEARQYTEFQYDKCIRNHVKVVKGLEGYKINNGRDLVAHDPTPELNDIIQECFFKINGIHEDDLNGGPLSDAGDMTAGE